MNVSDQEIIDVFTSMVKIDTTNPTGNEKLMTDYIGSILDQHDIAYDIIEVAPGRSNLISRIGSSSQHPPVVFISHTDVVSCEDQPWSYPPFSATELDGLIYGRGTLDTKYLTAMQLMSFIQCKDAHLPYSLYFVASADEEKGSVHGMPHVVEAYHDDFIHAQVINEGGGFFIENRGIPYYLCTVGEKGRCDISVTIEGTAGPASFKGEDKAIDTFTQLLQRMADYEFPLVETATYRQFTTAVGNVFDNPFLEKFAWYNSHDAFIVQKYDIGKQVNVLPSKIQFDMALQLLPGRTESDAKKILDEIFATVERASYSITDFLPGFESSSDNRFYRLMEETAHRYYTFDHIIPVYALGRTDGRFLGQLPSDVYGFSPVTKRIPFETVLTLVHQVDEHIDRDSVILGTRFLTDLLQKLGR